MDWWLRLSGTWGRVGLKEQSEQSTSDNNKAVKHLVLAHPIIVELRWSTSCTEIVNLFIAKRKSKSWLKFSLNHKTDGRIR